jgi:hypothetical protein
VTTYSRYASCSKGHRIEASFTWDPANPEGPKEYSEPCPVPGCDGRVDGKLPVGADPGSLVLARAQ